MKRLFRIDESEKDRILGMHKTATSKQYLKEQASTGETESEEVAFDCEKINEVLEKPEVKNWVEKITGPAKWTIRRGSEKLAEKDMYKGVVDVIKIMQCKLDLEPSGVFDNNTDTKLKSLQSEKGLKSDGIVGPKTWGAMFVEETESEEAPSANECYMNYGEGEGVMIPNYENSAKAARKKGNRNFIFFEDGTVIIWEGNQPMGGREQDATYQWRCNGDDVEFFKKFDF